MLYSGLSGSSWFKNQSRCCADDNGARPRSASRGMVTPAGPRRPPRRRLSSSACFSAESPGRRGVITSSTIIISGRRLMCVVNQPSRFVVAELAYFVSQQPFNRGGQFENGGRFKKLADGHFHLKSFAHPRNDLRHQQGMSSELNKIIMDAHAFQVEDFA